MVIEAAIKGLRIGPCAQRLAQKTPKTVIELFSKLEEYIRLDIDFCHQQREHNNNKGYNRNFQRDNKSNQNRYNGSHNSEIFNIENSRTSSNKEFSNNRDQQNQFRGGYNQIGGRGPHFHGGRSNQFGSQRKLYCVFYGEDKGHTTKYCDFTIQKHKEISESNNIQPSKPKEINHNYPVP